MPESVHIEQNGKMRVLCPVCLAVGLVIWRTVGWSRPVLNVMVGLLRKIYAAFDDSGLFANSGSEVAGG